jgi:hypothetical protein
LGFQVFPSVTKSDFQVVILKDLSVLLISFAVLVIVVHFSTSNSYLIGDTPKLKFAETAPVKK